MNYGTLLQSERSLEHISLARFAEKLRKVQQISHVKHFVNRRDCIISVFMFFSTLSLYFGNVKWAWKWTAECLIVLPWVFVIQLTVSCLCESVRVSGTAEPSVLLHGGEEEGGPWVTGCDPACLDISSVPVRMHNHHHINAHAESLLCTLSLPHVKCSPPGVGRGLRRHHVPTFWSQTFNSNYFVYLFIFTLQKLLKSV